MVPFYAYYSESAFTLSSDCGIVVLGVVSWYHTVMNK